MTLPTVVFLHPSDELYGADRSLRSLVLAVRDVVVPLVVLPADMPYRRGPVEQSPGRGHYRRGRKPAGDSTPALRPRNVVPWLIASLWGVVWLARFVRRNHAVGIVSNTTAIAAGPLVARYLGIPHVWYVREIVEQPTWYRGFVRRIARVSRGRVIAVSRAVAAWLGPIPDRGPDVMYNGVDLGTTKPLPTAPQAMFVGRLNRWKGQEVFVEAAAIVHARLPDVTFRLVGGAVPGDEETASSLLARTRSLDPTETWLRVAGEVPDARQ